jgi:hypothetical protein
MSKAGPQPQQRVQGSPRRPLRGRRPPQWLAAAPAESIIGWRGDKIDQMVRDYAAGANLSALGQRYGVHRTTVRHLLFRGVTLR